MKERFDNYANLCRPVPLPCFIGDERKADVWCDGYAIEDTIYDGFTNKHLIVPLVRNPRTLGMVPVSESYTIGVNHLVRIIVSENVRAEK